MGIWGIDIFEDDLALDIKDMFEELVESGESIESAVSIVLEDFEESLEDFDEGATVVLALCELAAEKGNITEDLKSELSRLSSNNEYWNYLREESEALYEARRGLLNKLIKRI
ncbi:protein of unknown function [Clostridium amylolyticum]|uniref:DUF4259 domain-containing protein n=1 Tax=Clostridium amylolyticum TaxID=1121298 RepID=A0A1M6GJ99_9CLOT|nr:DUF4259 domain-containing protein [Clostridium amylolyticum]SHJ10024.1 protein of unknown function [Clostridium amylolyticum]